MTVALTTETTGGKATKAAAKKKAAPVEPVGSGSDEEGSEDGSCCS